MHIYNRYYKRRWPKDPNRKVQRYGERHMSIEDETEIELLGM